MMFGMLAASDRVAVLARMKEIGADPRVTTIISGVSIINDGCAFVSFSRFSRQGPFRWEVEKFVATLSLCFLRGFVLMLKLCLKEVPVVVTVIITVFFCGFHTDTLVDISRFLSLIPLSSVSQLCSSTFLPKWSTCFRQTSRFFGPALQFGSRPRRTLRWPVGEGS